MATSKKAAKTFSVRQRSRGKSGSNREIGKYYHAEIRPKSRRIAGRRPREKWSKVISKQADVRAWKKNIRKTQKLRQTSY